MTFPATDILPTGGGTLQDYVGFATRALFVTWAAGKTPATGTVIHAGGLTYRYAGGATPLVGLSGWAPEGSVSPAHFATNTTPGTTDMTTAILAAFTWCDGLGGGVIDGQCQTFAVSSRVDLAGLNRVRCTRCTFTAIGTWTTNLALFRLAPNSGTPSTQMTFEDCTLEGSQKTNGWLVSNAATVQILRCRVHGVPGFAVQTNTKATELRIEGCDFRQWTWGETGWDVEANRTAKLIDLSTADYIVMHNVCAYAFECVSTVSDGPGQIHSNHFYNGGVTSPVQMPRNGTLASPNVSFVGNYIDNGLLRIDAAVLEGTPGLLVVANHFHKNGNGTNQSLVEFFNDGATAADLDGVVLCGNTFANVNAEVIFTGSGGFVADEAKLWSVSGNASTVGGAITGLPDISSRTIKADKNVLIMADPDNTDPDPNTVKLGTNGVVYHQLTNIGWWGVGMGQAAGGGAVAFLGWSGSNFLINPAKGDGTTDPSKQLTYDVAKTAWQFKAPVILAALADLGDASKRLALDLGGIATGTTRTVALPDASGTMLLEGQPIGATTPASVKGTGLTSTGLVTSGVSDLGAVAPGALGFGAKEFVYVTPTATGTFTTTVPPKGTRCSLVLTTSGTTSRTLTFGSGFVTAGTLATGTVAGKKFLLDFVSDGTALYESNRSGAL